MPSSGASAVKTLLSRVPPLFALAQAANQGQKLLRWWWSRPTYPQGGELRLHLGCGSIDHPGFVNIDARPGPHVHHVQGVDRLAKFADNSVGLVYSSHCLEHVPHTRVSEVLREWHRVLRPGGILRISVPDFDLLLEIYRDNGGDMDSVLLPLMGGQDYPFNFHYNCFNQASLDDCWSRSASVRPVAGSTGRMRSLRYRTGPGAKSPSRASPTL